MSKKLNVAILLIEKNYLRKIKRKREEMKSFLKQVLAVVVGFFVVGTLFMFMGIGMIAGLSTEKSVEVENNSILKLNLAYAIPQKNKTEDLDFSSGRISMGEVVGLEHLIRSIQQAKTDDNIKGIYLELSTMPNSLASIDALRRALEDFKSEGKFIIAYGEYVAQKAYYLATVADKIYINPEGMVELRGIGTELMFFKKALDKLEIDVEVFKVGTFKSAVEPFIREDISDANRKQLEFLLSGLKENFINNIAKDRAIEPARLNEYINDLAFSSVDTGVQLRLIDDALYYDQVEAELKKKVDVAEDEDLEFIKMGKYAQTVKLNNPKVKEKIAVVYAEGDIVSKKEKGKISSEEYAKIIAKLRKDEKVKAIVLRINSPGGSALASEVIWREIEKAKESKKVVVSMGSLAASGGYYIACNADKIFAEKNTITGSIGVFGLVPNAEKFLSNTMGVTTDQVELNEHATMNGVTNALDAYEKQIIQKGVDRIYETFTSRVAEGRAMPLDSVKKYAEGRVWTGEQAKDIGFVDEIGDLQKALAYTAELANLTEYRLREYPEKKTQVEEIMEQFGLEQVKQKQLQKELGAMYPYYKQSKELEQMFNVVQAKMPFGLEVK